MCLCDTIDLFCRGNGHIINIILRHTSGGGFLIEKVEIFISNSTAYLVDGDRERETESDRDNQFVKRSESNYILYYSIETDRAVCGLLKPFPKESNSKVSINVCICLYFSFLVSSS